MRVFRTRGVWPFAYLGATVFLALSASGYAQPPSAPVTGQAIVTRAAAQMTRHPSLEAKLRQRVGFRGHDMVGSGTYQQITVGRQRMLRLELKIEVANQVTSVQQISDGTTLWIRRDSGKKQSVEYVNLRQIRQALGQQTAPQSPTPAGDWFAFGGLDQLLVELNRNFEFAPPEAAQIGSLPVWQLNGKWKQGALEQLGQTTEHLLAHFPHVVKVTLGRDELLPLFPYQIEYARRMGQDSDSTAAGEAPRYESIAAMDLLGLRHRPDLTALHFRFQPNDQEVVDVTARYLDRLQARIKPSDEAE